MTGREPSLGYRDAAPKALYGRAWRRLGRQGRQSQLTGRGVVPDPGMGTTTRDAFVALGSAGLRNWITSAQQLHAGKVYAGQATDRKWGNSFPDDETSWMGREFSPWHSVNPADPAFGAHVFGVETGGDAGLPVTKHDAVAGDSTDDRGYLDKDTESADNVSLALGGEDEKLTPPTPFRETLPRPVPQRAPEAPAHG